MAINAVLSEIHEVRSQVAAGDVSRAANLFIQIFGIPLTLSDSTDALAADENRRAQLVEILSSPVPKSVEWWADVADSWASLGIVDLATACVKHARLLVLRDRKVQASDLRRLASFHAQSSATAVASQIEQKPRSGRLSRERLDAKQSRMSILFGRGTRSEELQRLEEYKKQDDIWGMLLIATTQYPLGFDVSWIIRGWYFAGEMRAAIEHFLGYWSSDDDFSWDSGHVVSLFFVGKSLQMLGDHATALACFRLAWWLVTDEEKREIQKSENDGESGNYQELREALLQLKWAEKQLDSSIGLVAWSTEWPAVGRWMQKRGLARRYLKYLDRFERSDSVFKTSQRARYLTILGKSCGWCPFLISGFLRDSENAATLVAVLPPPPDTTPIVEYQSERSSDLSHLTARAFKNNHNPFQFAPPPRLDYGGTDGPPDYALNLGFFVEKKTTLATVEGGATCPLLMVGNFVNDAFIAELLRQLRAQGKTVVHIVKAERPSTVPPKGGRSLNISTASKPSSESQELLAQAARSLSYRTWLREVLTRLLPQCNDPSAGECLDVVLRRMQEVDWWYWLARADEAARTRNAIELVNDYAAVKSDHPRQFRRVVVLVDYVMQLMNHLSAASCTIWEDQLDDDESGEPPTLVTVSLPATDSLVAGVLAIAKLGSLIETAAGANRYASQAEEVVDDFDINVRKRESPASTGSTAAPDETPEVSSARGSDRRESIPEEPFESTPWSNYEVVSPDTRGEFVIVFSGCFGTELPFILNGFKLGTPGSAYPIIVAAESMPMSLLCRDSLEIFRSFVLGSLSSRERRLFQISTGIDLSPHCSEESTSAQHSEAAMDASYLKVVPGGIESHPMIIWPPT